MAEASVHTALISDENERVEREEEDDDEGDELASPGRFIWTLTLCAGVSGLLFGYEYVAPSPSSQPQDER